MNRSKFEKKCSQGVIVKQRIGIMSPPRNNLNLEGLPAELLSAFASFTDDVDLLSLRRCSNRAIRNGVDYVFVGRFLQERCPR